MGGDYGPQVTVPAALDVLTTSSGFNLVLVGDEAVLEAELKRYSPIVAERLSIQHASQQVEMGELPSQAMRTKKDSSMRVAIDLVKAGRVQAAVSAGNTGALMATARFVLKTLPGIDRPAICTVLPTATGYCHVLDLGANVDCTAEHLFQFAVMGSALGIAHGKANPTVGLLNIGQEEIKGNDLVKEAALRLEGVVNYKGFVEGDEIFQGVVDVIVCDGFVGNVLLKTSEGVAKRIAQIMKEEFTRNWRTKLAAVCAKPVLQSVKDRIDPRLYNGASLVGLNGVVIKSHGGADKLAFANAICEAVLEAEKNVPQQIRDQVASMVQDQ